MILTHRGSFIEIEEADKGDLDLVKQVLVVRDPNPGRYWSYREGRWSGYHNFFLDEACTFFPSGFLSLVTDFLTYKKAEFEVQDVPESIKLEEVKIPDNFLKGIKLRSYQIESIEKILAGQKGIVRAAPRSGKTVIQIGVAKYLDLPSLLLVDRTRLLEQHYKQFHLRGLTDVGRIWGDVCETDRKHLIGTVQTIYNGIKRGNPEILKMLHSRGLLQGDEIHHVSNAKSWHHTMVECTASYRIGYSGTPLRSKYNKEFNSADFWLKGFTGEILVDIGSEYLRERGYLVDPTIYFFEIKKPNLWRTFDYHTAYKQCIVKNEYRNNLIVKITKLLADYKQIVLVLVKLIPHGKDLMKRLNEAGVPTVMSFGGDKLSFVSSEGKVCEEKDGGRALDLFQRRKLRCIVSSTVMNEGIDIPSLSAVIIAAGGKSSIQTIQRAFRGMTPLEGKEKTWIFDFTDKTNSFLYNHSKRRMKDYREEKLKIKTKLPPSLRRLEEECRRA